MLAIQRNNNKKGFTLAELLVVVAIIAVLVAVSIPIFTAKLEKAREATDIANLRAAKAIAATDILQDDYTNYSSDNAADPTYTGYYDANNGVIKSAKDGITAYGKGTSKDGKTADYTIGTSTYTKTTVAADKIIKVTIKGGEIVTEAFN